MRFLHTADWHLGRTIRGRSRQDEFESVLDEVVDIARREDVEVVLVCGDVYDTATPSPDAERLLYETLRDLAGLGLQVLLITGNHDNPRRFEALGKVSDLFGVHVQWRVRRPDEGGVITLVGREHAARIAAIPWIQEGRIIDARGLFDLDHDDRISTYHDQAADIYRLMCEPFETSVGTVNLLAGHIFISGSLVPHLDNSERTLHVGQTYGVSPAALPSTPQYLALGHVHRPQEISAPIPAAYAGSLLQLDFGESGQQKVVRIIDAEPGRPVKQRTVPLTSGRPLVEVRGTLDEVTALGEQHVDAYLRVVLDVERPEPGLAQRVRDVLPGAVDVRLAYDRTEDEPDAPGLAALAPTDLFARYYRSQHGVEPAPELLALFNELLEEQSAVPA